MGVFWRESKQRWVAEIRINGKEYSRHAQTREEAEVLLEELRRDPNAAPRNRAVKGNGSVYWSEHIQRWIARIKINGTEYMRTTQTQEEAESLLAELKRNPEQAPRKQAPNGSGTMYWSEAKQAWIAGVRHNGKLSRRYAPPANSLNLH